MNNEHTHANKRVCLRFGMERARFYVALLRFGMERARFYVALFRVWYGKSEVLRSFVSGLVWKEQGST